MNIQYLSDSEGRNTAVVIPIEYWNEITAKHQDLKILVKPKKKLSEKYKGTFTEEQGKNLNEHIKQMRSEWNSI
ncbi:MAG: hypothetical protein RIQ89_419 [Bacteroidota bacterium]